MTNPFHDSLDRFRGQRVRVTSHDGETLEGWVERVHHHDRHVALRDATDPVSGEDVGRAFLAHVDAMVIAEKTDERIERVVVDDVHAAPWSAGAWDPAENRGYIRSVREEGFVGSYPVVRSTGEGHLEVVEGHKRLWVAEQAGLETHPVAIVDLDTWEAVRRFVADHFPDEHATESGSRPDGTYSDDHLRASIEHLVGVFGADIRELSLVDYHMDRLDLAVQGLSVREISGTDSGPDRYVDETAPTDDEAVAAAVDDVDEYLTEDDADETEGAGDGEEVESTALPAVTDAGDPFHGEPEEARVEETADEVSSESDTDVPDLTPAQQDTVDALATHGELLASELKSIAELGGGLHHMLSPLVDDGVIERRQDPDDGRRFLYSLPESESENPETDVDEGVETDDAEDAPQNPYTPDDLGTLSVKRQEYNDRVVVPIPRRVTRKFDSNRVHVRERGDRIELAPGTHDDWPDYSINSAPEIGTRRVIRGMLDVVPGDEVRAIPDGDVVVLEPQRCAERDRFVDVGTGEARKYGRQKQLAFPVDAERLLEEPDQVHVRETEDGYEIRPGEHDGWPTYSQQAANSGIQLGAQALDLLGVTIGQEVRARGDRERGVIELAPAGQEFDSEEGETEEAEISDDEAPRWRDHDAESTPDDTCENCGAELVDGYAAVFEPEDGDAVRCCPNCEDKLREGDGTVRPKRNVAGGEASD